MNDLAALGGTYERYHSDYGYCCGFGDVHIADSNGDGWAAYTNHGNGYGDTYEDPDDDTGDGRGSGWLFSYGNLFGNGCGAGDGASGGRVDGNGWSNA